MCKHAKEHPHLLLYVQLHLHVASLLYLSLPPSIWDDVTFSVIACVFTSSSVSCLISLFHSLSLLLFSLSLSFTLALARAKESRAEAQKHEKRITSKGRNFISAIRYVFAAFIAASCLFWLFTVSRSLVIHLMCSIFHSMKANTASLEHIWYRSTGVS